MIFGEESRIETFSLASNLEKVQLRTKEELLTEFGGEEGIERKLGESISKISTRCVEESGGIYDRKLNEDFLFLYELYSSEELRERFGLDSYKSFSEKWLSGLKGKEKAWFVKKIGSFIEMKIHPQRVLELWEKSLRSSYNTDGVVDYQGVWYLLPDSEEGVYINSVESRVLDEIIILKQSGRGVDSDYYHTSGSSIWQGVLEEGGLKSGRSLLTRNKGVVSGELITTFGQFPGEQEAYSISSLGDVYAEKGMALGYATIKWFDEYPIVFGISKQKMTEWKIRTSGDLEDLFVDLPRGDGAILGDTVPNEAIEVVYCPISQKKKVEESVASSGLGWRVISIEAFKIMHGYDSEFNPGEREVVTDWVKFREMGKRETL